jgi:DnaK suppressor protein
MIEAAVAARKKLLKRQVVLSRLSKQNESDQQSLRERQRDVESNKGLTAVLVRLSEGELREVDEIDAAIKRIDDGVWGQCEACGEKIKRARLVALPEARKCLPCVS